MRLSTLRIATLIVTLGVASASCDSGNSGGECGLSAGTWSTATSGGLCQANFFGDTEYAVYCAQNAEGRYECACGPIVENPQEFTSTDFCDLEGEARACEAIKVCGFPI
jgi:hypothetical protein